MTDRTRTGGCLCGAVRYALDGSPDWAHHCHCSRCRRATGASFATNLFVPLEALRFTQGEAHVRSFRPPEAERFTHAFCEICGGGLPFRNPKRGRTVVPMGSLDGDPGFTPRAHIFVGSKAPWVVVDDALPQHPEGLDSTAPPHPGAGAIGGGA